MGATDGSPGTFGAQRQPTTFSGGFAAYGLGSCDSKDRATLNPRPPTGCGMSPFRLYLQPRLLSETLNPQFLNL